MPSRWRLARAGVASLSFDRAHSGLQITSPHEARQTTSEAVRAARGVIRGTTQPVAMKSTAGMVLDGRGRLRIREELSGRNFRRAACVIELWIQMRPMRSARVLR